MEECIGLSLYRRSGPSAISQCRGDGAMRGYQEMLYGVSRHNEVLKAQWRRLLLRYCELDTAAMVMVWTHWTK
jgi:hypothetical protein